MKGLAVLGSTGSIGQNTLEIVRRYPDRYSVISLAAGTNADLLRNQIKEFHPRLVSVKEPALADQLRKEFSPEIEFVYGSAGLENCIHLPEVSVVIVGIVGFAGLAPTLYAIRQKKRIALANKESLVVAGPLLQRELQASGAELIPVDSEHSALFQLLDGFSQKEVATLVLTASGGPLLRYPELPLEEVTPEFAIRHPNWKMGPKISVDSATLMNKALEVIEAHYLFNVPIDNIEVWIHPQSLIHGAIWFKDNSCAAQLNRPDMKLSIGYALSYPERLPNVISKLSLKEMAQMEFFEPDPIRFSSLTLARAAFEKGHSYLIALNAANEVAVQAFLERKIPFSQIPTILMNALETHKGLSIQTLDDIIQVDRETREKTTGTFKTMD